MSNACGNVIFFVQYACLEFACLPNQFRIGQNVFVEVAGGVRSGPDSDCVVGFVWNNPGVLQRGPRKFQHDSLLRTSHLGRARRGAEKAGVEMVGFFDDASGRDVVRVFCVTRIQRRVEFIFGEDLDGFDSVDQIFPKLFEVAGAGHACCHSDDRVLV